MRRTVLHIALIAALMALAGQVLAPAMAFAAYGLGAGGSGSNPAISSAVQEALNKAQAQKALGGAGGAPGASGLPGGAASVPGGAGAAGSGAAGSSGSFSSLTGGKEKEEEPERPERKLPKTAASTSLGPLSAGLVVPIVIAAGGLLAGIAFLIVRDARGVAPAGDFLADAGAAAARAARLRKRRAKAKAARKQRKRNR